MNDTKTRPGAAKQPAEFEFVIMRIFDAPRERVWKAWTEAERLGKWWGPKDFDIVSVKLDLRPGGMCHYLLR
ncbi:MAG: SRPBCC domain-containing protein, partial [bacterium]